MTRQITTVAELETLLIAVSEHAEPAIVYEGLRPWIITESEEGEFWGWSYREEDDHHLKNAVDFKLPLRAPHYPGEQDRPLPDRERIARAMEQVLIEAVGTCTCTEAYTIRNLYDPECLWHNANPHGEFPEDAADAVLKLFQDKP